MLRNRFLELIAKKKSGEISPSELIELKKILDSDAELFHESQLIDWVWEKPLKKTASKEFVEERWLSLQNKIEYNEPVLLNRPSPVKKILTYLSAAAVLAAVVIGSLLIFKKGSSELKQNIVSTKKGSRTKLDLPDGTQVWLNADSKITYNEKFGTDIREVALTGEAFFDVVKDKEHPFVIHTSSVDIRVLGTAFNVRSYANEKRTETSLIRGLIEITLKNSPDKKRLILNPSEKLVVQDTPEISEKDSIIHTTTAEEPILSLSRLQINKKDSTTVETLWTQNKLVFDHEKLEEVVAKIERWYGVQVTIADDQLKKIEYTGVFDDENLFKVMEALRLAGNFKYSIQKNKVTISL